MAEVLLEEHVAAVQGQVDAVMQLCAVMLATHPMRQKIEEMMAEIDARAKKLDRNSKDNKIPLRYSQGMQSVLGLVRRHIDETDLGVA